MVRQLAFFQKYGPVITPGRAALHALLFCMVASLTGCVHAGAPALSLIGSFVPYWMFCVALALILTIIIRVAFIKWGIDDVMPVRLVVYFCLMLTLTFIFSLFFL